jgi:hypothetical protein
MHPDHPRVLRRQDPGDCEISVTSSSAFCCGPGTHCCTSVSDCVVTQLVENLKREGLHPMEKALDFDALCSWSRRAMTSHLWRSFAAEPP